MNILIILSIINLFLIIVAFSVRTQALIELKEDKDKLKKEKGELIVENSSCYRMIESAQSKMMDFMALKLTVELLIKKIKLLENHLNIEIKNEPAKEYYSKKSK